MRNTSFLAVCAAAMSAPAADPVDTSFLKRYAETRGFLLGRPAKPKITPDGKTALFLRSEATVPKQKLFAFDVATGTTTELLAPETLLKGGDENLTPEEKARRERQRVTVGGFADYHLDGTGTRVLVLISGRPFVFDRTTNQARELKAGKGTIVDPKWSPDGKLVSYVRDHDVYAYDLAADRELAVTTGGTATKTHGLAEFVAQEEMGRHTGYWWSPDSRRIAYTEADHAGVEVWSIADPFKPDVRPPEQFYPRPGKKNVSVRLGVKPVAGGETVWVEWDRAKFEYLAGVTWQKYGPLTFLVQNRKQQTAAYCFVDPKTAETKILAKDSDESFLNTYQDGLHWLGQANQFVRIKQGVHFNLGLFGSSIGHLLEERWEEQSPGLDGGDKIWSSLMGMMESSEDFRDVVSLNPKTGVLIYARSADREPVRDTKPEEWVKEILDPTQTTLHYATLRFPTDTDRRPRPTGLLPVCKQPGVYSGVFTADQSSAVITRTDLKALPQSLVYGKEWKSLGELPSVADEPPFKPNVTVQKVGDYWTAVVRPRDFDPKKKYPVIVDVYGGPRHLHVVQAMRNWLVPQWLADQGFVVVAVDNRGTPGRGRDWERAVYQKFGTVPLEDQAKGLAALRDNFPELDRDRVGIVGWSFGGYMAANAVLRRPDVFKAAVAGAPVTDWEDYDTHYTERYLGLLPESRAAYDEASLLPLAKNLSRPLLLVHGTADDNVYFRHTLKLSDALTRAGKEHEVLPLPGVTHMYTADPLVTERLWARSVGFFKRHLGEPK